MTPEEKAKRFNESMKHVQACYTELNMVFSKPNKIDHMLVAYQHLTNALSMLGQEQIDEAMEDRESTKAAAKPDLKVEAEGNILKIDFKSGS